MNTVEDMTRLDDAPCSAPLQHFQSIATGAVDTCQPEYPDRNTCSLPPVQPLLLRMDTLTGMLALRIYGNGLVSPLTVPVTINTGR